MRDSYIEVGIPATWREEFNVSVWTIGRIARREKKGGWDVK